MPEEENKNVTKPYDRFTKVEEDKIVDVGAERQEFVDNILTKFYTERDVVVDKPADDNWESRAPEKIDLLHVIKAAPTGLEEGPQ